MYLSKSGILNTPKIKRINIINAVTGIKPGNLIGTKSNEQLPNLAIFNSIVHLGSNPGYLGFNLRPNTAVRRHTYENILENGFFTINHIHTQFIEKAHYTSAKFDKETSEFESCGLTEEYLFGFSAPFVKESPLKIGMKYVESLYIKSTNTLFVVGEIEHLLIPDHSIDENGYINLEHLGSVGISGLNSYYELKKINDFPFARVENLPKFDF